MNLPKLLTRNQGVVVNLAHYLWLKDLLCGLAIVNSEVKRSLTEEFPDPIFLQKLFTLLHHLGRLPENFYDGSSSSQMECLYSYKRHAFEGAIDTSRSWYYIRIIQGITTWPNQIDFDCLESVKGPRFVKEIFGVSKNRCAAFQGPTVGGNRAFVANDHFPAFDFPQRNDYFDLQDFMTNIYTAGRSTTTNSRPFTKVVLRPQFQLDIVLSLVAYFEIKIHEPVPPNPDQQLSENSESANCVAIGLALPSFALNGLMPGWRPDSFGYHGDDGRFFDGSSGFGRALNQSDREGCRFGTGDIVGCGVFYPPLGAHSHGGIFFTKNGTLVGEHSFMVAQATGAPWFPIVGTDTWSPIELNFGVNEPFQFDVENFEISKLREKNPSICIPQFQMFGDGLRYPQIQALALHPMVLDRNGSFCDHTMLGTDENVLKKEPRSLFLKKRIAVEALGNFLAAPDFATESEEGSSDEEDAET